MNGEELEKKIQSYIKENLINQLVEKYPELTLWRDRNLFVPEGFNKKNAGDDEIRKMRNALFLIRRNIWTDIPIEEQKKKREDDKTHAKTNKANRDIVIYELAHDKQGNLIYHSNGFPLYRKIPLLNIECKVSHFCNIEKILKRIKEKRQKGKMLNKKDTNIYILKDFLDWCLTQPDVLEKYPDFKKPDYSKDMLLAFFTTVTQSDNAYAVFSYDSVQNNYSDGSDLSWKIGYISKAKAKNAAMGCPEIDVPMIKRYLEDRKQKKMPEEVVELLEFLSSKNKIEKEDREYFVYGSDQKGRGVNIINRENIKDFATIKIDDLITDNNSFLEDIFTNTNIYGNKSMKDILYNYIEHNKNKKEEMFKENKYQVDKIKKEQDSYIIAQKYKQSESDVLANIDSFTNKK